MPQKEVSWIGSLHISLKLLCFPSSVFRYIPVNLLAILFTWILIVITFTGEKHFRLADKGERWLAVNKTVDTGGELWSSPPSQAESVHSVFLKSFLGSVHFLMTMLSVVPSISAFEPDDCFLEIRFEYYAIRGHTFLTSKFSQLVVMELWIHELVRWKCHRQHLI
jgi:hypothetical protein